MPAPTLVFDGDCAFCSRCAAVAERVLPGDCVVVPWQAFDLASAGVPAERARSEVLWIGRDGTVSGGARAVARALRSAGGCWSVFGLLLSLPPISWVAPPVYRLVAAHRYRLPGGTAACRVPPPRAGAVGPRDEPPVQDGSHGPVTSDSISADRTAAPAAAADGPPGAPGAG